MSWLCNGNRTEWSPVRSVIKRVITNSDDRTSGLRFVYDELITDRIGYFRNIKIRFESEPQRTKTTETNNNESEK